LTYTGPRGPMKMAKNHQATQNVYIVKTVKKDSAVVRSHRHVQGFRGSGGGLPARL